MRAPSNPKVRSALPLVLILCLGACAENAAVYGLKPEYPQVLAHGKEVLFTTVESTKPMMRWEAYPPRDDAKWVVYDLKVYLSENGAPGRLIDEADSLPFPRYQFQKALASCAKYFWTVRARFRVAGREEATEWGAVQIPGRDRWVPVVPDPAYYRFETPCR